MAALSHDEPVHGATPMDHVRALPTRPESRRRRLSVFSRPGVRAVDENLSTAHRSRRDRTTHSSAATTERMGFVASTALAIVGLVFVSAVALGSTLASASI